MNTQDSDVYKITRSVFGSTFPILFLINNVLLSGIWIAYARDLLLPETSLVFGGCLQLTVTQIVWGGNAVFISTATERY